MTAGRSSAPVAALAAIALAGCGVSGSAHSSAASSGRSKTTASSPADSAAAAASAYAIAFNAMSDAASAGITKENSQDPRTSSSGIQARIRAREKFDASVRAIHIPASLNSDAQAVLTSDAALEHSLEELKANVDDVAKYNQGLQTVDQEVGRFEAANRTLADALGLTVTGGGPASTAQ